MNKRQQNKIHYCLDCDLLNTGECGGSGNNKNKKCDFYRPLGIPKQNLTFSELIQNKGKIGYNKENNMYIYI